MEGVIHHSGSHQMVRSEIKAMRSLPSMGDEAMTPAEVRQHRQALGLSANGLAEALRLGKGGGRTVRRWESGEVPISGPASLALELLVKGVGK